MMYDGGVNSASRLCAATCWPTTVFDGWMPHRPSDAMPLGCGRPGAARVRCAAKVSCRNLLPAIMQRDLVLRSLSERRDDTTSQPVLTESEFMRWPHHPLSLGRISGAVVRPMTAASGILSALLF